MNSVIGKAKSIVKVSFPDTVYHYNESSFCLREKRIYESGLYLKKKSANARPFHFDYIEA